MKVETKRHQKNQRTMKILLENNFTFCAFKLFFPIFFATLHIEKKIYSIKTDDLGINGPISWTPKYQQKFKNYIYLHQSRITLFTVPWYTLHTYIKSESLNLDSLQFTFLYHQAWSENPLTSWCIWKREVRWDVPT